MTAFVESNDDRYRDLADALPEMIQTCDPAGNIDWVNERWLRLTGLDLGETQRLGWQSLLHPDDREGTHTDWAEALRTGTVSEREHRIRLADGSYRWFLCRAVPVRTHGGEIKRWIATQIDIDDRKRAEEALRSSEERARARAEELLALMDAVPAAIWISHDPDCKDVSGSRVGHEMLRTRRGVNLSKSAADASELQHFKIFQDGIELAPEELPLQVVARTGVELRDFEEELRFADGKSLHVFGNAVPLRDADGKPRGAIAAFVDVTRLKQAEQAVRESARRKDEFLAILSHELRNPLAPIMMAVQLMKLRGDVPAPKERDVIERQAKHLIRLVDDLLDVSRVARGKITLKLERLELSRVVAKAVEATSSLFEQKQHTLELHVPPQGLALDGDEVRLTQVLVNLLTNAARYTPPRGHISLSAELAGDDVALRVKDDGIGIEPELLAAIFEMFVQGARGPDRSEGGLGLGLALVRSLTALHGGTVEAFSEGPGRGSEFVLRLPAPALRTAEHPPSAGSWGEITRAENGRKVLIVDDNVDAADMLAVVLSSAGHDVRVVYDPAAALRLIDGFHPDVAVLDIGLPVMDGHELARELKTRLGARAPILIALSGYGQGGESARSQQSGFAVHLVKPVDVRRLLELVGMAQRA